MTRTAALARMAQTAFGLPSGRAQPATIGPAHRSLTVREQALFRATTRRALRAATLLGGMALIGLAPIAATGLGLIAPQRQLLLLVMFAIEGVIAIVATALAFGRWRLPPLPLVFALNFSFIVDISFLLAFVPEVRAPLLMLIGLLAPAVALMVPWGVRVQAAWLLAGAPMLAVVALATARGGADWFDACLVLAISGLVSLAGSHATESVRRSAFEDRMDARSAHLATAAREMELGRLNAELARVTRTDPLTGLGNRRRLGEELAAAAARATRYGSDCAIALLDLDGFKTYNDSVGHVAGDAALREVAAALVASARATDTVCRFGGDEFVVVMPEQPLEGAARAAERMQRAVEDLQLRYPTPSRPQLLTISAGIALLGRSAAGDEDEVLRQADAELYRAKGTGRNSGIGTRRGAYAS